MEIVEDYKSVNWYFESAWMLDGVPFCD